MTHNTRLVYSSDPSLNQKCPQCHELMPACTCRADTVADVKNIVAVLRMEKVGRGGKTVTVIDRLPQSESFLKELCTELKKKCGTGGTYRADGPNGRIEIQGDKRDVLRVVLAKKGMTVKG